MHHKNTFFNQVLVLEKFQAENEILNLTSQAQTIIKKHTIPEITHV